MPTLNRLQYENLSPIAGKAAVSLSPAAYPGTLVTLSSLSISEVSEKTYTIVPADNFTYRITINSRRGVSIMSFTSSVGMSASDIAQGLIDSIKAHTSLIDVSEALGVITITGLQDYPVFKATLSGNIVEAVIVAGYAPSSEIVLVQVINHGISTDLVYLRDANQEALVGVLPRSSEFVVLSPYAGDLYVDGNPLETVTLIVTEPKGMV